MGLTYIGLGSRTTTTIAIIIIIIINIAIIMLGELPLPPVKTWSGTL